MFYERTETGWEVNNKKSVLFNGSTHPIESIPADFWNADRKKAADNPPCDPATEKLVGPQEIGGDFVGYVAEDLTPEEIEAAYQLTIPTEVSMQRARRQLMRVEYSPGISLFDVVDSQINAIGGEAVQSWEYSQVVQRTNPLIATIGASLGWAELDLDQLFLDAANIED